MKEKLTAFLTILSIFVFTSSVSAELLGTVHKDHGYGIRTIASEFRFFITYDDLDYNETGQNDVYLFEDIVFTPSDTGSTFTASSATDPEFDAFTSFLTNGEKDYINFAMLTITGGGGIGSVPEIVWFADSSLNGIDLEGYNIERITLTVDNLSYTHSGGDWTEWFYDITYNFYGAVPEPTSLVLLGLGGLLLRKRRA